MRVAFVVQRYGVEITGGAEFHCRQVAEHMSKHWDTEILTTCAIDYQSWANHYPDGFTQINGLGVRRFPTRATRKTELFNRCYDFLSTLQKWEEGRFVKATVKIDANKPEPWWKKNLPEFIAEQFSIPMSFWEKKEYELMRFLCQRFWMYAQGPDCPQLIEYIRTHQNDYDAFVFFTYCYPTTFYGLPLVGRKAILVPTAHDDPCFRFEIYKRVFNSCGFFLFNTPEEQELVYRTYPEAQKKPAEIVGLGFEVPDLSALQVHQNPVPSSPYILYVGRLDEFKGTNELLSLFTRFKKDHPGLLKLCFVGSAKESLPQTHIDQVISLGFLEEKEKLAVMASALLVVLPSPYESLSMVMLEAFSLKVPILANGKSDVLVGQCQRSGGGLVYSAYDSFAASVLKLMNDSNLRHSLGEKGCAYVRKHYTWNQVESKYFSAVEALR